MPPTKTTHQADDADCRDLVGETQGKRPHADLLKEVEEELCKEGTVSTEVVDVSSADQVEAAAKATVEKHGKVDILVANAGIVATAN